MALKYEEQHGNAMAEKRNIPGLIQGASRVLQGGSCRLAWTHHYPPQGSMHRFADDADSGLTRFLARLDGPSTVGGNARLVRHSGCKNVANTITPQTSASCGERPPFRASS